MRRCSRRAGLALCLVAVVGVGVRPSTGAAQDTDAAWPRLEVRGGLAGHGAGLCSRDAVTGVAAGLDVRTPGRWIASAAVDFFFGGQPDGCVDVDFFTQYRGESVRLRAGADIGPRLSMALGYAFSLMGGRFELTGAVGSIPTRTAYDLPEAHDVDWRLWYGTAVTVRLSSGVGLQSEIGLHRVPERYLAVDRDVVIADVLYWEPMWRLAFSVPIIR